MPNETEVGQNAFGQLFTASRPPTAPSAMKYNRHQRPGAKQKNAGEEDAAADRSSRPHRCSGGVRNTRI